jgi:hypothetical protein
VLGGPLDVRWRTHGDEWIAQLQSAIIALVPSSQLSRYETSGASNSRLITIELKGRVLRSTLVVTTQGDRIAAAIEGTGEMTEDQLKPWLEAVAVAIERVRETPAAANFEWSAVIGTTAGIWRRFDALETTATIGSLRLLRSDVFRVELARSSPPSLNGVEHWRSWPIVVQGATTGVDWAGVTQVASRTLFRLCALLSLAWDGYWTMRQYPLPRQAVVIADRSAFENLSALGEGGTPTRKPV